MELQRTALIIGGCRGIGRAIALRLARDGFDVCASARKANEFTSDLEEQVKKLGRTCKILFFDVCDREGTRKALQEQFGENGAPDVVVYNAGITRDNLFVFMSGEEWDQVIDTNLNGFFNAVQPLIFGMIARKSGNIVVIGSASGQTGQGGQVNYGASKGALVAAAKSLAREVGRKNIRVNVVAPGFIETEMTHEIPLDKVLPLIPMHRAGAADEVAGVVGFLCGPDSSYVHGQVLAVNGGLVI